MILAGVKLATGYELKPTEVGHTEGTISFVRKYLQFGEWLFQVACHKAVTSKSFKRVDLAEMSRAFSGNLLNSTKRFMDDISKSFEFNGNNKKIEEL